MANLKDIQQACDTPNKAVNVCVDDATPSGHFLATVLVLGMLRVYLLKGNEGNPDAEIKGNIVVNEKNEALAYRGKNLIGGEFVERVQDYKESLLKLI